MPRATKNQLNFIATLDSKRLKDLQTGAGLTVSTGYTVRELIAKATVERMKLASLFQRQAVDASQSMTVANRLIVSRAYYAMYHCFRAVVFFLNEGDEFEKHSDLPNHIPEDFPGAASWENDLKNARLERNRADYEPYPTLDAAFAAVASSLLATSQSLQRIARSYLRGKGLDL